MRSSVVTHNFDPKEIVGAIVRGVDLGTQRLVFQVQNKIKSSISGAGTGIFYPGNLRRSSSPGEPPAKQRGHLSRSWQSGRPSRLIQAPRVGWRVGSNLPYARFLEFGTGLIRARPYVRPALASVAPDAKRVIEAYIRDELRKMRTGPIRRP